MNKFPYIHRMIRKCSGFDYVGEQKFNDTLEWVHSNRR